MTTEKIITSLDQHGRMLIPSNIRERFNISPNDKVTIELTEDALVIRNVDYIINEMNAIFTKNQTVYLVPYAMINKNLKSIIYTECYIIWYINLPSTGQ